MPHRRPYDQVIAEAMAGLDQIAEADLDQCLQRLTATSEALNSVLESPAEAAQQPTTTNPHPQ